MKFTLNDALKETLNTCQDKRLTGTIRNAILQRNWITTNDLLYLSRLSNTSLSTLVKGIEVYTEPKVVKTYSPEVAKRLQDLKSKLEESEYQSLIKKDYYRSDEDGEYISPQQMAKEVKSQITTIFNILISVCSVVYAIWYWTQNHVSLSTRVLLCLFFGILILVAEVVVFNSYIRKIGEARDNERKKKEVKSIVDTIVFNG